ncbi:class I SAM-dependent methyltransferase [Acetonema longum]|uniref:SAM-dependent methyltransferase n=1 Tax=Acetonema longum DSM 6540 TaxID=1009370 RepID=F7NPD1_9FIRM|nr:class I SAM-dependent methyltransferase [Acetonema longum]EGO62093.1 hypothetical protein ALO_19872 [Acetonema longum DSM 6540]
MTEIGCMNLIVTTAFDPSPQMEIAAQDAAQILEAPLIQRKRISLAKIRHDYALHNILVITRDGPLIHTPNGEFFFHVSMGELRIKNLADGKHDHMVAAMQLRSGMSVLDCTAGLATDALVASYVTGETGAVTGLESSPIIAFMIGWGLQNFCHPSEQITQAARRVRLKNADYAEFLATMPNRCFDIVYFDPMFRHPNYRSSQLNPMRDLADNRSIDPQVLREACRIARQRVVVKEGSGSKEFQRLGITDIIGGKYSRIAFGVIELGG